jgi:hypothetical protein
MNNEITHTEASLALIAYANALTSKDADLIAYTRARLPADYEQFVRERAEKSAGTFAAAMATIARDG